MKKTSGKLLRYQLCAVLYALFFCANAQAYLSISAQTDRTELEITGNLYLTVTVSADSGIPEPQIPAMPAFNVYSSGRSQNISIINGKMTTSASFTYALTPRFIGRHKIPSISVSNGNERSATPEIEVNVVNSGAAPPPQQPARPAAARPAAKPEAKNSAPIFLKAETDRKTAYPGQQINLYIRFYTAIPLTSNPQYQPPSYKNLVYEDLPPVRSGEVTINGTRFSVNEIKTALFGLTPGPAEVGPASVAAQLESEEPLDPFDPNFFQRFFAMRAAQGVAREFKTEPLRLSILPLPEGAPASFSGAVGKYSVEAAADRRKVKAGEAVNLSVTVSGSGSLKTVTAPKLPDLPDFKVFDTMNSLDVGKQGDVINGKKVFTTILVPRLEGRARIPPVKFSFFDPEAKAYRELETHAMELEVEKGDSEAKSFNFTQPGSQPVSATGSDIRYVSDRARPPLAAAAAASLAKLPLGAHLFPAAALLLAFWLSSVKAFRLRNPRLFRFRRAKAAAGEDMARAEAELKAGRTGEAVSVLYDSFMEYLSGKTGEKVAALTTRQARELIMERFPRTDEYHLEEIRAFWERLEMLHFSPSSLTPQNAKELITAYEILVEKLEREFKKKGAATRLPGLFLALAFFFFSFPAAAYDKSALTGLNEMYRNGKYQEALDGYLKMTREESANPAGFYNAGNAYFRLNMRAQAVLYYAKAFRLSPRNSDIRANLDYALRQTGQTLVPDGVPKPLHYLYYLLSDSELKAFAAVFFWLACLAGALRLLAGPPLKDRLKAWPYALACACAACLLWSGSRAAASPFSRGAVAAAPVSLLSGPGDKFKACATIPEARLVKILDDTDDNFYEVGLTGQGIKGWAKKSDLQKI